MSDGRLNALVHERDALLEALSSARSQLEQYAARHRHALTLTCDRCRRSIAVTSSLAVDDRSANAALFLMARNGEWRLCEASRVALGLEPGATDSADLCGHCAKLR
jgi:hypothetical protein